MAEGNWLITSLIVILMVVLLTAIISFLVVAFLGNTFFESGACCCPVCTTTTTATTATTTAIKPPPKPVVPATHDPQAVADAASALLTTTTTTEPTGNRLVQVLYIDGKPVAAQTRSLTTSRTATTIDSVDEPKPVADVAIATGPITSGDIKPTDDDHTDDETDIDEAAIRQTAAIARKDARNAKTAARKRFGTGIASASNIFDQTTETLTPAQAAAVTAYQNAKKSDAAAANEAAALIAAGEPVPNRPSAESALPSNVRELTMDAAVPLTPPIDPAGPINGTAVPSSIRQILRLMDVALLSGPNEPIVIGADILCVSMAAEQFLRPRILAVPKSTTTSTTDCPFPSIPIDRHPAASSTSVPTSVPAPKGRIIWRGDPITVRHGVEPIRLQTFLKAIPTWTAGWSLRVELTDATSGLPLAGACARIV